MFEKFIAILSGLTACVGLWQFTKGELIRSFTKRRLGKRANRMVKLEQSLASIARVLQKQLRDGTPWTGIGILPEGLHGISRKLKKIHCEIAEMKLAVELTDNGSVKLRKAPDLHADLLEELLAIANVYQEALWSCYQANDPESVVPGANGCLPSPIFDGIASADALLSEKAQDQRRRRVQELGWLLAVDRCKAYRPDLPYAAYDF